MARKSLGAFMFFALVWFASDSFIAAAQEIPFSADSLMEAFKKGSQVSLKGTEIRFKGVISEIKGSRVIFKSSANDNVFCELAAPLTSKDDPHPVGSPLTVIGRVRGRGFLGNVTLDQCSVVPSVVVSNQPVIVELPSDVLPQPALRPAEPAQPPEPVLETTDSGVPLPGASVSAPKHLNPAGATHAVPAVIAPAADETLSPVEPERPVESTGANTQPLRTQPIREASNSSQVYLRGFFDGFVAVAVILVALLAMVKFGPAIVSRLRTSPATPNTEKTRRAALEALLLGQKKK